MNEQINKRWNNGWKWIIICPQCLCYLGLDYMHVSENMYANSKIFNSKGFPIVMGKNAKHLSFYLCWNH